DVGAGSRVTSAPGELEKGRSVVLQRGHGHEIMRETGAFWPFSAGIAVAVPLDREGSHAPQPARLRDRRVTVRAAVDGARAARAAWRVWRSDVRRRGARYDVRGRHRRFADRQPA